MGQELMRRGAKGLEVARVQAMLNAHGAKPKLDEDGDFGPQTDAAVRKFQESRRLDIDGIVGPRTRAALNPFRVASASGLLSSRRRGSLLPPVPNLQLTPLTFPALPGSRPAPRLGLQNGTGSGPSGGVPAPTGGQATATGRGWIWQVQPSGQASWTPWAAGTDPSNLTTWSGALSIALTYRTRKEGFHIETGPILQGAVNSRSSSTDPLLTFTGAYQVTFADIFAPGKFHILSPFIQGSAFINAVPGSLGLSLSGGDQLSYEIIDDRFSIFAQPSLIGAWNLTKGGFTLGPGVAVGATIQW